MAEISEEREKRVQDDWGKKKRGNSMGRSSDLHHTSVKREGGPAWNMEGRPMSFLLFACGGGRRKMRIKMRKLFFLFKAHAPQLGRTKRESEPQLRGGKEEVGGSALSPFLFA